MSGARSVSPEVIAVAAILKGAAPMPLRRVTGAGEEQSVAGLIAGTKKMRQFLVNAAMPLTVAPAGHDDGAGEDARSLPPCPADSGQELIGTLRFPVGQQQFRLRGQGVNHFGAQNAVLAVLGLQIAVETEGADVDGSRQRRAQMRFVAVESGVQHCYFQSLSAPALGVPGRYSESFQHVRARQDIRANHRVTENA